jgi:hypothetical protein
MSDVQPQTTAATAVPLSTGITANSIRTAKRIDTPFTHWNLVNVLPEDVRQGLINLPVEPATNYGDVDKRNMMMGGQQYFDEAFRAQNPVCQRVCEIFASPDVISALQQTFSIRLRGSNLRIGYHVDGDGFQLEPHMDVREKLITINVYLDKTNQAEELGTDVYVYDGTYEADNFRHVGQLGSANNSAMVFLPCANSWHGFEKRPITGKRKVLIVNYVTKGWRATHELFTQLPGDDRVS